MPKITEQASGGPSLCTQETQGQSMQTYSPCRTASLLGNSKKLKRVASLCKKNKNKNKRVWGRGQPHHPVKQSRTS